MSARAHYCSHVPFLLYQSKTRDIYRLFLNHDAHSFDFSSSTRQVINVWLLWIVLGSGVLNWYRFWVYFVDMYIWNSESEANRLSLSLSRADRFALRIFLFSVCRNFFPSSPGAELFAGYKPYQSPSPKSCLLVAVIYTAQLQFFRY